ncbi:MAG: hypothetical protein OXF04_12730 [bacterium]|nr:hypothetical protein [bacterium]
MNAAESGLALDREFSPRVRGNDRLDRGDELVAVLELAAEFPACHSPTLEFPAFGQ